MSAKSLNAALIIFSVRVKTLETPSALFSCCLPNLAKRARLAGNMNWALNKEIIMQFVRNILKNSKGATAIEYGLIAALIAVAAISAMTTLGGKIGTTFNSVSSNLK